MRGWSTCPLGKCGLKESDPATSYIPFRFTSKEYDEESGLYYHGARYYEPRLSRWMSADPAGFALINPNRRGHSVIEATNWYSYVRNNPVRYVDPTGKFSSVVNEKGKYIDRRGYKTSPRSGFSSSKGTPDDPDTITWTALYLEISVIVGIGKLDEKDPIIGGGIASVRFENEEGDAFMADYEFTLSPEETNVSAATASATVSVGVLKADFPTEQSHEWIAASYEDTFHNKGISVWRLSAQHVSDTKGNWQGGELGVAVGGGASIGRTGFEYQLLGTRPVAKTTENYYSGRYGSMVPKKK